MILDPLQRRFGYGAARLPIVRPAGIPALSSVARKPHPLENAFAALPSLFCVGIAFLLFVSIRLDGTTPLETPIEIRLWSEAARPVPTLVDQSQFVHATVAKPSPQAITSPQPLEPPLADQPVQKFNLASIANRAPRHIAPNSYAATPINQITRPDVTPLNRRVSKTDLALSVAAPSTLSNTNLELNRSPQFANRAGAPRPHADESASSAKALDEWSGSGTRRRFLLAHAETTARGPQPARSTRPPAVSAPGLLATNAADRFVRENLRQSARGAGWHEVPLEELPDCSPAGRQDLLKKRILFAAPFERECSHRNGSYRFVETRNLGAFLMWSRTNPDRPAGQPRAMNVCDVLERALRCLDASSTEESIAK